MGYEVLFSAVEKVVRTGYNRLVLESSLELVIVLV